MLPRSLPTMPRPGMLRKVRAPRLSPPTATVVPVDLDVGQLGGHTHECRHCRPFWRSLRDGTLDVEVPAVDRHIECPQCGRPGAAACPSLDRRSPRATLAPSPGRSPAGI